MSPRSLDAVADALSRAHRVPGWRVGPALVVLGAGLACGGWTEEPPPAPLPPNVLIVVLDDVGSDKVRGFGGDKAPPTPTLDALAAEGVAFRQTWAMPLCSPTRASILTGRLPYRTGIGFIVDWWKDEPELAPEEITLPEMLQRAAVPWDSSAVGKWHLGSSRSGPAETHPGRQGFAWWSGTMGNLRDAPRGAADDDWGYMRWMKNDNGHVWEKHGYATTDTADDAISRVGKMKEPWLLYVAFNAPHVPLHVPPPELRSPSKLDDRSPAPDRYDAALEAVDHELGRILAALDPALRARTWVFVVGDNGTADDAVRPPIDPEHAKGSPYDAGVHVPLIVTGPGVPPGSRSDALVSTTDLFPTVAEIAGVDVASLGVPLDGRSLGPLLRDPSGPSQRPWVFSERFSPNGQPTSRRQYAIRDARYSLVVREKRDETTEELFDLQDDPLQRKDLLSKRGALGPEAKAAYDALKAAVNSTEP